MYSGQWRPEGLQLPGTNAWIGAPPPFGKSCIRPWEKNRQAKKKWRRKKRSSARKRHVTQGDRGPWKLEAHSIRPIKIRPYKLGRRPLQALHPGAMAPPAPPPSVRHWQWRGMRMDFDVEADCGCVDASSLPWFPLFVWVGVLRPVGIWDHLQGESITS